MTDPPTLAPVPEHTRVFSYAAPAPASPDAPRDTGGGPVVRPAVSRGRVPAGQPTTPSVTSGRAEVLGGGSGPDPGSQPRPVDAVPQAQDIGGGSDPWAFLRGPEAGAQLFVAGFVALLFSIGGLVAVGIRRHRW
jgi:hypothetical protein